MHGNSSASTPVHGNRLYNSAEARALLGGISERTFRTLTVTGRLPARKQGGRVYVTDKAITEYIAALPSAADPATDPDPEPAA